MKLSNFYWAFLLGLVDARNNPLKAQSSANNPLAAKRRLQENKLRYDKEKKKRLQEYEYYYDEEEYDYYEEEEQE